MKSKNTVLWILIFYFCFSLIYRVKPAKGSLADLDNFSAYNTHPNFWSAGLNKWTAKRYKHYSGSSNFRYNSIWVWSGPYDNEKRQVIYQGYRDDNPGEYLEWELWQSTLNKKAIVFLYGGDQESSTQSVYRKREDCINNNPNGYQWPDVAVSSSSLSFIPFSWLPPQNKRTECRTEWVNRNKPGGYTAVYMAEEWGNPFSSKRIDECDQYIPFRNTQSGNWICKISPRVGKVYQRYALGDKSGISPPQILYGCEATIYSWGYPETDKNNFQLWFRNGELRWSRWLNLGSTDAVHSPDDSSWWNNSCYRAWTEKSNWLYTGKYKLNTSEYHDSYTYDLKRFLATYKHNHLNSSDWDFNEDRSTNLVDWQIMAKEVSKT